MDFTATLSSFANAIWKRMTRFAMAAALVSVSAGLAAAQKNEERKTDEPIVILALGDSLTAGYQLPPEKSFPAQLEKALKAKGYNVRVENAGVSGDTAADGLARLDWSLSAEADAVIVELGANDALRGFDPKLPKDALAKILAQLKERGLPVLLAGMEAPRNWGPEYTAAFAAIYPELAETYGVLLYSFFLDGVAANPGLNLADGLHPNAQGVGVIVENIMPYVEKLISHAQANARAS